MRILYGDGFDDTARMAMAPVIASNLIAGTVTVLENAAHPKINCPLTNEDAIAAGAAIIEIGKDTGATSGGEGALSPAAAAAIKTLWLDDQFQTIWLARAEYQLFDCYPDFAKKCTKEYPDWGGPGWIPSVSDVTKARVRTSGIVEEQYNIDGVEFRMYDVGGQRNERKKWIHCFENVTAIIFVGAISEYDQVPVVVIV